jgi:AraC-like DNA-binding protein
VTATKLPSLRYASLSGYLELAGSLGLDGAALMSAVGLDPLGLATPDEWVPAVRASRLLELSAHESGHDDFGLRLGEYRQLSMLGPLSLVLRQEPTLRDALALLLRYEHTYNEAIRVRLSDANGLGTLRLWFEFGEPVTSRQAEDLAVAVLHGLIRELLGTPWQPLSVCFTHEGPATPESFGRLLGGRLQFGHDFTGLVMYARDLDASCRRDDPGGVRPDDVLGSLAPRGPGTARRVKELVELLLPTGRCSVDEAARTLGMDRRTLHRHLAGEHETFTSIVDGTRASLAERYLANDRYPMTEISQLLGFAAPSAFTRWFQRHFGESPTRWRARRSVLTLDAG